MPLPIHIIILTLSLFLTEGSSKCICKQTVVSYTLICMFLWGQKIINLTAATTHSLIYWICISYQLCHQCKLRLLQTAMYHYSKSQRTPVDTLYSRSTISYHSRSGATCMYTLAALRSPIRAQILSLVCSDILGLSKSWSQLANYTSSFTVPVCLIPPVARDPRYWLANF
jgi:hypothetical protein